VAASTEVVCIAAVSTGAVFIGMASIAAARTGTELIAAASIAADLDSRQTLMSNL